MSALGGNPNWKKGVSGNPRGRPPGVQDRRQRMQKALGTDASTLIDVVKARAMAGDMQAASLILARLIPVAKAEGALVNFAFDASQPLAAQVEAVLQAVADGHLSPDVARQVVDVIDRLAGVRQADDLAARITALEAKG
jgi:hypothetical protein